MRLVGRVERGECWFPDGIGDVVAHTDGRWLAVTVTRDTADRPHVVMHEFDCAAQGGCLNPLMEWLVGLPQDSEGGAHLLAWGDFVATRLVAALGAALAVTPVGRETRRLGG